MSDFRPPRRSSKGSTGLWRGIASITASKPDGVTAGWKGILPIRTRRPFEQFGTLERWLTIRLPRTPHLIQVHIKMKIDWHYLRPQEDREGDHEKAHFHRSGRYRSAQHGLPSGGRKPAGDATQFESCDRVPRRRCAGSRVPVLYG